MHSIIDYIPHFQEDIQRFERALGQQHFQFDSATSKTEQAWSLRSLNATKKTSSRVDQAWSITHVARQQESATEQVNIKKHSKKTLENSQILDLIVETLTRCPGLHCKLHGSTDAKRGDLDRNKTLMARFKLKSELSIQDELARQRTMACKDGLVARGVLDNQLLVTWAGGGKLSKVNLFVMRADEASDAKAAWEEEEVTAP